MTPEPAKADSPLYWYAATVDRVVDGDTVDFVIDLGFDIRQRRRVRLFGIDTPEKSKATYEAWHRAQVALGTLLTGERLLVRTHKDRADSFGRYLAEPFTVGEDGALHNVCDTMVQLGHAAVYVP